VGRRAELAQRRDGPGAVVVAHGASERREGTHLPGLEAPHAAVVEDGDPAVSAELVVAGCGSAWKIPWR
jgi:hypothetical protein